MEFYTKLKIQEPSLSTPGNTDLNHHKTIHIKVFPTKALLLLHQSPVKVYIYTCVHGAKDFARAVSLLWL